MTRFIPTCLICNKEFYSRVGLRLHLKEHTKQELSKSIERWGVFVN